jgi:hypothetical protein
VALQHTGWYQCQGYGAIKVLYGSTVNVVAGGQDEQGDNGVR